MICHKQTGWTCETKTDCLNDADPEKDFSCAKWTNGRGTQKKCVETKDCNTTEHTYFGKNYDVLCLGHENDICTKRDDCVTNLICADYVNTTS